MKISLSALTAFLLLAAVPVAAQLPGAADPSIGGIPTGQATGTVIPLSLAEAIERGLRYNLAGILGEQGIMTAAASRQRIRSRLLPNLSLGVSEANQQVNLKALGFRGFPGMPAVVGPFSVFDARGYLSQALIDLKATNELRAGNELLSAAEHSYQGIRDRVVFVCAGLYLRAVTGKSRIVAARAQLDTAEALYQLAVDRKQAGVIPGIEVVRAQVQLQSQQQRLIVAENDFATQKLELARAIGLPLGQEFDPTDELAYAALSPMALEDAVQQAYRNRGDLQSTLAQLRAAEAAKKAAAAERLPTLRLDANYGINGPAPGESHGSYAVAASLRIPLFEGGQARARVQQAESAVRQRQAEAEDLQGRIYYEVRASFLDLDSSEERVRVAGGSVKLAEEQLAQARDRFSAGVASNIEVVEAQEAVAAATEAYISSLYAHNIAKGRLAEVLGAAESSFLQFLRGNP